MSIDISQIGNIESNYGFMTPPESESSPLPEEKICPKCLEVESECECAYYDQIEAEELKAIQTDRKIKSSDIFRILEQTQLIMSNLL